MLTPTERTKILVTIKRLVLAHHINIGGVDYAAWLRQVDTRAPDLLRVGIPEFESGVRELLLNLSTSHTAFYHSQPKDFPPQHTINGTVREAALDGGPRWMFLDVFEEGPADRAGIKPGDVLESIDGVDTRPPDPPLFAIGRRHTLAIRQNGSGDAVSVNIDVPQRKGTNRRPPIVEPKSPIWRVLPPDVGLLKIPYFPGSFGMGFTKALDAAMADLKQQGCRRLIVDLRGNIGGSLGFARLASYLCPDIRPIGHSLTPQRLRAGYKSEELPRVPMPANNAALIATLVRFAFRDKSVMLMTQGLGPQPFHARTAILVNEWTNSAAEIVAAFAAEQRLATLIGTKTRGNVLGAANFKAGSGYWVRLPVFGWFTAEGRNLDGVGMAPAVEIHAPLTRASVGYDTAMARAVEIVGTL